MPDSTEYLTLAIPNFNGAKFIGRTLESLNANGSAVRWWLQDADSSDDSVTIAKRLARPGDVICQEKDAGQADAINRAFSKMGGEIIGFINSDDCLCPGAANKVVEFFRNHPEIDLVYGQVEWIDEYDQVQGSHAGNIQSLAEILDIFNVWWGKRNWVQPEVFFRRSLWEKAGPFDNRYYLAFDYEFWVRCFRSGAKVAHLPEPLARFRRHALQKSTHPEQASAEIRMILRRTLEEELPISKYQKWILQMHLAYEDYRLGSSSESFATMLMAHPAWLLLSDVRDRIRFNLGARLK